MSFPSSPRLLLLFPVLAVAFSGRAMAYPGAPSTWGTWTEDVYFGFSPKQISATTDPDGRLRATFINARVPAVVNNFRQALMFTYRRADATFRQSEAVSFYAGLPAGSAFTNPANPDFVDTSAMALPLRTKVLTASQPTGFAVRACLVATGANETNGAQSNQFASRMAGNPVPFPLFPRRDWSVGPANLILDEPSLGSNYSRAVSIGLNENSEMLARAVRHPAQNATAAFLLNLKVGTQSLQTNFNEDYYEDDLTSPGRIRALDSAISEDGKDCYHLLNTAVQIGSPSSLLSGLRLIRQRITPTPLATKGVPTRAPIVNVTSPRTAPFDSVIADAEVHLTHATGEPKWITWTDTYNTEIRVAKRLIPLPDAPGSDDTNQDRRINGGYTVLPPIDTFAFGCDAALDRLDRLHLVWWTPVGGLVHYARENSSGGFDEITLPTPASGSPALAIGPGDYPYIMYAGATTASPNESAPLIVTTPPGLQAAYRGDYEDRDGDGRPGLIERAQGSNDLARETGSALRAVTLTSGLATISPGVRHFETGFQIAFNSVRVPNTTTWNLADGNDTIRIQPSYSSNGMASFSTGFFTLADEFTINGQVRYVTVRDSASVTSFPRQSYRLLVTRIPGAP